MAENAQLLAPNDDVMWKFIMWWFRRCSRGVIEVGWTMPGVQGIRHFKRFALEDEAILPFVMTVNKVIGCNVYIRVSTIDPDAPIGHTQDIHVWQIPGLFADLDTLDQIASAKKVVPILRPLAWVKTGAIPHDRMQPYFLLDEPLEDGEQVRELNRRVVRLLQSDPAVINPSRLMRLPGTIAWPTKPGRVAEMTSFILPEDGRPMSYPLHYVERQLPRLEEAGTGDEDGWGPAPSMPQLSSGTAHISLESELLARVKRGDQWHTNLLKLIARWVGTGLSDAMMLTMAAGLTLAGYTVTQTEAEMRTMIGGARKKWDKPDPVVAPPPPPDIFSGYESPAPVLTPAHPPRALWAYSHDVALRLGVDPSCVALSCLTTLASVATDAWRLQPKRRDKTWTECARLWSALVGDPSILKSPVIQLATKPIERLDALARLKHRDEMEAYELEHAAWKAAKDGTPEPKRPKLTRYMVENATIEALSEVMRDDAKGTMTVPAMKVLCRQDEMSEWFANMDRYKSGGRGGGDRGAFLRLYNGGRWTTDRIGRGNFAVPNWSACFLGGVQPGPIQKIARDSDDDGLLQRFIFIVPWKQEAGVDKEPDWAAQTAYEELIEKVMALRPPTSLTGADQVVVMHEDAQQHRTMVEDLARVLSVQHDATPQLQSALGKWPGLFARLCLTYHLIEVASGGDEAKHPLVVSEATAKRVSLFMREILLPHLYRAHALFYLTPRSSDMQWVAGHILAHRLERVTMRDLMAASKAFRAPEARANLDVTMAGLVTCGWLEIEPSAKPTNRPPSAWVVNPQVHIVFAQKAQEERKARQEQRDAVQAAINIRRTMKRQADADPDASNEPDPDEQ